MERNSVFLGRKAGRYNAVNSTSNKCRQKNPKKQTKKNAACHYSKQRMLPAIQEQTLPPSSRQLFQHPHPHPHHPMVGPQGIQDGKRILALDS